MRLTTLFFTIAAALLFLSVNARGDIITVTTFADVVDPNDGVISLREAVNFTNANTGNDVIDFAMPGTYTLTIPTTDENQNADGDLDITDTSGSILLRNTSRGFVTIDGNGSDRVLDIQNGGFFGASGVVIANGRVDGSNAERARGGGIRNRGILELFGVTITNNRAEGPGVGAGGIRNEGDITLNNVTISFNTCLNSTGSCFGGGFYGVGGGSVNISNSFILNNASTSTFTNGFGIAAGAGFEGGNVQIVDTTIANNEGNGNGTGGSSGTGLRYSSIASLQNQLVVRTGNFVNNVGNTTNGNNHTGGGIALLSNSEIIATFDKIVVNGNTGTAGGGMFVGNPFSTVHITNSTFSNNSVFSNFSNTFGSAAMLVEGKLIFTNTEFFGNSAGAAGSFLGHATIYNQNADLTISNSNVHTNTAEQHAVIRSLSNGLITTTRIESSAIYNNTSAMDGAGISSIGANAGANVITEIINTTVSGNRANGRGAGVFSGGLGNVRWKLSFATVAFNRADDDGIGSEQGGGVGVENGDVNVKNSIFSDNSNGGADQTGSDCSGTIDSFGYNGYGRSTGCQINVADPSTDFHGSAELSFLRARGGFTATHALNPGSPAINAADPNCTDIDGNSVVTDQRGVRRPLGGRCDIGAFESGAAHWRGGAGDGDFSNPANYEFGTAPDSTTFVVFDDASMGNVNLNQPATVAGLIYGGGYNGTLTLNADLTVTGNLGLYAGNIVVHSNNNLILGANATVIRTSGSVQGNVQKFFSTNTEFTFPTVSPSNVYLPVIIKVTEGSGEITVRANDGTLPGADPARSIPWNWTIDADPSVRRADLTFTYADSPTLDEIADELLMNFLRRNGNQTIAIPPTDRNTILNEYALKDAINFSDWSLGQLATTAAAVNVGGRVQTARGMGIGKAMVKLSGGDLPAPLTALTNPFGHYNFEGITPGQSYVLTVSAKRYRFNPDSRVVFVGDNISNADFVAGK